MKVWMIVLSVLAVIFGAIALLVGMGISANNYGVRAENGIVATYSNNQNILSNYSKKVLEAVQVPAMYTEDFTKIVTASMQGRYGADGSKASMQWLKEMNIPFDSSLYANMQRLIESGRNEFQAGQERLIDEKRSYNAERGQFPRSMFMSMLGFPKIDLNKYDIVTDARTDRAFETKKEETLQLRPSAR